MLNIIGIIPARGGSKGLPGKNIKTLAGKPLIVYTIEAALKSRCLNRVIVSTDTKRIAKIAGAAGAEIPFLRPKVLAGDNTALEPVLIHALKELEDKEEYKADIIVLLQPTSPLRGSETIDRCLKKLLATKSDSVLSVCQNHPFLWKKIDGRIKGQYNFHRRFRRQRIKEKDRWYRENGAVYATQRDILLETANRLGGKIEMVVMDREDSLEIDTPFDFWLAEQIIKYRGKK